MLQIVPFIMLFMLSLYMILHAERSERRCKMLERQNKDLREDSAAREDCVQSLREEVKYRDSVIHDLREQLETAS